MEKEKNISKKEPLKENIQMGKEKEEEKNMIKLDI